MRAIFLVVSLIAILVRFEGLRLQADTTAKPAPDTETVTISADQAKSVKPEKVGLRDFATLRIAVGNIDYYQDRNVQVFAPYQGRIRQLFAKLGDDVKKGEPLFSIDSPDLIQAESTAIAAAGVYELTTRSLERAKKMRKLESAAQKDLDQATSDQQTAAGALKAARGALRIFGKSEADIDQLITERKVDGEFLISAPIDGRITSRTAAIGLLLQPGNTPPPFTLADISTLWVMGYLLETDFPSVKLGAPISISVSAYPDRQFKGQIAAINTSVDPNTHRVAFRAEVGDPKHELLPQMIATVAVQVGEPTRSPAVPISGVVREGDGTMTVWVTKSGLQFNRRDVKIGVEQEGWVQVLQGLEPGETVAGDGALFLSTLATSAGSGN